MSNLRLSKDFYSFLPKYLRPQLDATIDKYGNEPWFEEAFEAYRQHVLGVPLKRLQTPNLFFVKYLEQKPVEEIFTENPIPNIGFAEGPIDMGEPPILIDDPITFTEEVEEPQEEENEEAIESTEELAKESPSLD